MLQFYNTLSRKLEDFIPLEPLRCGIYTCGPTVYNYAHIGNLRTYIFEDTLRRTLEYAGFSVRHVMNVTDVGHLSDDADSGEDKIERSARESGRTVWDLARFYTEAFFRDAGELNILTPGVVCRATDHIDDMIALIKRLEERGLVYLSEGNVYFDISRFPPYGRLARLVPDSLRSGARIAVDQHKKNPQDFVLWFTKSKFENPSMLWDSPWGRGYPGWHIECSAMSMKYLGETFDIHCGGVDHIPIHHTNEIAQSEGATGKPWVRYWLHGEFLLLKNAKMSKSSGTFLTLADIKARGFHPLDYRYFCLTAHYRSQLIFSWEALAAARQARKNLEQRLGQLKAQAPEAGAVPPDSFSPAAQDFREKFCRDIGRDLGLPQALARLWGLLKEASLSPGEKLALALDMDRVFGLNLKAEEDPGEKPLPAAGEPEAPLIEALIEKRAAARKAGDFAAADQIRRELLERGIMIRDLPGKTLWFPASDAP